jgi:hypothetical protein
MSRQRRAALQHLFGIETSLNENKLLPNNHFGARNQKSTVLATSHLQKTIYDTWRGKKILSLVSFDVKGAYNNFATGALHERLRERRIVGAMIE